MRIIPLEEGKTAVFALEGRLDTNSAPQLDSFATDIYASGLHDIAIDMSSCPYISSAGLRVIVTMQKRATTEGSLVLRNVPPEVMDTLVSVGFDTILTFE